MNKKLEVEAAHNRILGPLDDIPFPNFHISPLGLRQKKEPNEYRLIHDLSFPKGQSVNDGIEEYKGHVTYAKLSDAIASIRELGPNCYLSKVDIEHAFKIIPVHADDIPLLGFMWEGKYFADKTLPMGLRTSCRIFEQVSSALEYLLINYYGVDYAHHILDDFLLISPNEEKSDKNLEQTETCCDKNGIPLKAKKTVKTKIRLDFTGITLDTSTLTVSLPDDKLEKCSQGIDELLNAKSVRLRKLLSILGMLNFACTVITPGRAFLRRLYDLTRYINNPNHFVRITMTAKKDLKMWKTFLHDFNGTAMMLPNDWLTSEVLHLYTDSAQSIGFGIVFGTHWAHGTWPEHWTSMNITLLELFPIIVALHIFGQHIANQRIILHTDNEALTHIINSQTCKDSQIMILIRHLVLLSLKYNVMLKSEHIAGRLNTEADLLSRLQIDRFLQMAPSADKQPTQIPQELLPANFKWN